METHTSIVPKTRTKTVATCQRCDNPPEFPNGFCMRCAVKGVVYQMMVATAQLSFYAGESTQYFKTLAEDMHSQVPQLRARPDYFFVKADPAERVQPDE